MPCERVIQQVLDPESDVWWGSDPSRRSELERGGSEGQQGHVACSLDGLGHLALLACGEVQSFATVHLAVWRQQPAQLFVTLVVGVPLASGVLTKESISVGFAAIELRHVGAPVLEIQRSVNCPRTTPGATGKGRSYHTPGQSGENSMG